MTPFTSSTRAIADRPRCDEAGRFGTEVATSLALFRVGVLAVSSTNILGRYGSALVAVRVDRFSSELYPTRTISVLPSGQYELLDTMASLVEHFDAGGRLIDRKHRTGESIETISYVDPVSDKIDRITDAAGGETVFAYDGNGKAQQITDARGRVTSFTINAAGDLVTLAEPSETWSFVYQDHRMTEKHSPRNDVTQYTFRADGTMQTATKPGGAVTMIDAALSHPPSYDANGKLIRIGAYTDAHGVEHQATVNALGRTEKDVYTADGVTRTTTLEYAAALYDVSLLNEKDVLSKRWNVFGLVQRRLTNGVTEQPTLEYDAHGRVINRFRGVFPTSMDYLEHWRYDADGWVKEEFHGPANYSQFYERDAAGHVTRTFDVMPDSGGASPTGREQLWTYNADGLVATATDHGVTRTFTYDPATKSDLGWTDALGRTMTYTRDTYGNVTSTSDGTATSYADFDARNRVVATRDALGNETTYGYAHAGCGCSLDDLVTSIHTPDLPAGVDWQMTYDADRRLASVTDPYDFTESYEYEPTGEMKKLTDKLNRQTTWTHDSLGRVATMIDTLGRHHGNLYVTATPREDNSAFVGPTLMAGSANGTASTTSLAGTLRNGDYQIGKNVNAPDGLPPLVSLYRDPTFELGFTHRFDAAMRDLHKWDRTALPIDSTEIPVNNGPVVDEGFGWDVLSSSPLLKTLSTDAGGGAVFNRNFWWDVMDQTGHRSGPNVSEPFLIETFGRDVAGRVTQIERNYQPVTGYPFIAHVYSNFTYRPDGRLSRIVNPDGQHDFTYNSRGLVETQVVTGEGTYTYGYDGMGRNNSLEYPDGHVRHQVFDDLGRITSRCYEYTGGGTTRCYTASYDAVGNPLVMMDPEGEDDFEYDALDRLKKATRKDGNGVVLEVDDYAYNALGALKLNAGVALDDQRPRKDGNGNADAAVPASVGGQPVTLDLGGRVTSMRSTTFTWAKKGYVLSVQEPVPASLERYGVDAELRRIVKLRGSVAEYYVFEGMDRVATLDTSGALKESYLFDGVDHPLRIEIPGVSPNPPSFYYYELDLAGNVRRLRASGGGDLGGYRFSAFGKTKEDTTTLTQQLRWKARWQYTLNGQELYDVRARQWAPEIGAFISIDEFEYHDYRTTLWGWPKQNPVRFRDPLGRVDNPYRAPHPQCADKSGTDLCLCKCEYDYYYDAFQCRLTWGTDDSPFNQEERERCKAAAKAVRAGCECKCRKDCDRVACK